jgi:hypothetical protein
MPQDIISEAHIELLIGPSRAGLASIWQSGKADREAGRGNECFPADYEWSSSMVNSR